MSRPDLPLVIWKHCAHGYEAMLSPDGPPFARARMVKGVPGVHYELVWFHGPRLWRPFRVFNIMKIERFVDHWVSRHRESLLRKMVRPGPSVPPFQFYEDVRTVSQPKFPDQSEREARRSTCPGCGRRRGLCSRTASKAARTKGGAWPCRA